MAPHHPGDRLNSDPALDAIAIELAAMQAIAEALAAVRDPQTRLRVLQWVNERFNPARHATQTRTPVEMPLEDDPGLAVESLYAFFERPRLQLSVPPVESTSTLASRTLAAAALEDDALAMPTFPDAPLAAEAVREPHAAREDQPLDSLVRGIATDLKRLAVEWQTT